jgi:hypothetical protein
MVTLGWEGLDGSKSRPSPAITTTVPPYPGPREGVTDIISGELCLEYSTKLGKLNVEPPWMTVTELTCSVYDEM